MSEVYPDSIKLEMQFAGTAGAWTDVTEDVIRSTPITCTYGIQDSSPLARVASTGTFNFALDNSELNSAGLVGYYSPGHANCRSGFQAGITVRFSVIYGGISYPKFYGRIPATGIQIIPGSNKERKTTVEVRDFMEQCAIHEIDSPAFVQNKTSAELIQLVLAEQSIHPLATEYKTCEDTFFSAFEDQSLKLTPLVEISNICLSEFGYAYIRHDADNYEKFVVEGRKTRTGITSATTISVSTPIELCGYLLKEDSGKFQLEDASGYIKLNESTVGTSSFINSQYDAVIQNGNDLYNDIVINSIPKTTGTAIEVLYNMPAPIAIPTVAVPGVGGAYIGSALFYGKYNGLDNITALSISTPVIYVDYEAHPYSDGTGGDSSTKISFSLTNNYSYFIGTINCNSGTGAAYSSWTFYLTRFKIRGTALKSYTEVSSEHVGSASINSFGKSTLTIDMPYQIGTAIPATIAGTLLTQYQDPITRTENIMFFANTDINMLSAYLVLDIGDRFTYQESVSGVNSDYFINGVTFEVHANNIIKFGYKTKAAELEVF
jgi:hypothetical protein